MYKLYFDQYEDENRYRLLWGFKEKPIEQDQLNVHVVIPDDHSIDKDKKQIIQDYTMRDLFLWSILMNRIDMAKIFLSHLKYRICAALIATKILKEYHKTASHGDLKENYAKSAEYFQEFAIECINQCEKNDADQACQIVLQRIELYGNVTCLQVRLEFAWLQIYVFFLCLKVAADAKDKLFIARPCCVQAMNNVWYDKIHQGQSRIRDEIAMGIGFFSFGLLAPFFVTYRKGAGVGNCFFICI